MRLESIALQRFANFTESQGMDVEPDVTCLIGKNESGKTTILKALHRLNPANNPDSFDITEHYPRRFLSRDRKQGDLKEVAPIRAVFALDEEDIDVIGDELSVVLPPSARVEAWRTYGGALDVRVRGDFAEILEIACNEAGVDHEDDRAALAGHTTVQDVVAAAAALVKELTAKSPRGKNLGKIAGELKKLAPLLDDVLVDGQRDAVIGQLPKFFYFSTYEMLPGECDLTALVERENAGTAKNGDLTMLALLRRASDVSPKDFLDENYDRRKAASLDLSRQVFQYWKQNPALSVQFDTDMPVVARDPEGREIRHRVLKIELMDERHGAATNFSTRSAGFQWFFSFLAAFSDYQESDEPLVVLLDEPGTSLHGDAQRDFLRYIFEELGTRQQVIYTTHSQHMVDPTRYETMRAIHDQATKEEPELGVAITPVNLSADRNTILPVEAALGYSVAQHLFLGSGPHLAVEGSSDFVFLTRLSDHLFANGRQGLDPSLSIIPVGGIGNMPAFVALMGRRLRVRALIDGEQTTKVAEKVFQAAKANGIADKRVVVLGGAVAGLPKTADIEDLFTTKDYLWLYNRSGHPQLDEDDLPNTPEPILRRIGIARRQDGKPADFDHAGPAHQLTRDQKEFFAQADGTTVDRFEEVFRLISGA
ncbi:AAA family ATPase [Streptomyces sp. CB03911]|uniref:ATP-dependent nuclease n=1 Tax=Streptomyces sp. CB03911 TaxID=1804758 RepID=UPI0009392299|nr:AAA family ATPase [Streptomyces sp. CB03911]OKI25147.1 hypothetical protein A6A07_31650 [Streptomyces sp. CB03911]